MFFWQLCRSWLMLISLRIRILLMFGLPNTNTLKNWNMNTFFTKLMNPFMVLNQNTFHFFFAMEYEYNYPVRDMDLSPRSRSFSDSNIWGPACQMQQKTTTLKESRATLACLDRTSGRFYMLQLTSVGTLGTLGTLQSQNQYQVRMWASSDYSSYQKESWADVD